MHVVVQQSCFVSWITRWCQDILSISIVVNPLRFLSVLCCFADLLTSQRSIRRNTLPRPDISTHSLRPPQPTQSYILCILYTHINFTYSLYRLRRRWGLHLFEAGAADAPNFSLSPSTTHSYIHSLSCTHTYTECGPSDGLHEWWSITATDIESRCYLMNPWGVSVCL